MGFEETKETLKVSPKDKTGLIESATRKTFNFNRKSARTT
jgi:hypothetical protein